jgi:hypothetical protein
MLESPPPLRPRDLPEKSLSFWQLAGPGAILVGLSIGAGEIIVWPRLVAEYGASMVWAAGVGVFLQLWLNFEVARYTLATGESVYAGFSRIWRGFGPLFILFNLLGWLAPGWGRASGLALKALLVGPHGWGSDTTWTIITFSLVAALLFGPRFAYKSVERSISILVVFITVSLILLAIKFSNWAIWGDLAKGMINIPYRDPRIGPDAFFGALVFAGAGGTANLFYSFYLRDKGIGMARHGHAMITPLHGGTEEAPTAGSTFPPTPDNLRRFRTWFRHVTLDQILFFWILNSLTILLFIYAALAIMHPRGIVPQAGTLIWDEAHILEELWGPTGRTLFLIVGFATLFSTQLALLDGVARSLADIIHTQFPPARKHSLGAWYMAAAIAWMIAGCSITFIMEKYKVSELGFLLNAAYMGGFAMAVYAPLLLLINHRLLPAAARPGRLHTAFMILASAVYVGFALFCIYWEISRRIGA